MLISTMVNTTSAGQSGTGMAKVRLSSEAGAPTSRSAPAMVIRGSQVQISLARPHELGPDEIAAWHSMQRTTGSLANPFMSPEFAVAISRFRADARIAVLTDGPEVVGFFPFEKRRFGVGVPIGAGLSNRHGLIHVPAIEWDPGGLLRACKLSVWQFDYLAEGQRPFEHYAAAVTPSALIDLTDGFASYK